MRKTCEALPKVCLNVSNAASLVKGFFVRGAWVFSLEITVVPEKPPGGGWQGKNRSHANSGYLAILTSRPEKVHYPREFTTSSLPYLYDNYQ